MQPAGIRKGRETSLAEEIPGAVMATAALDPALSATAFRWERKKTKGRCISDLHLWWSSQAPFIIIKEKWANWRCPFPLLQQEGLGGQGPGKTLFLPTSSIGSLRELDHLGPPKVRWMVVHVQEQKRNVLQRAPRLGVVLQVSGGKYCPSWGSFLSYRWEEPMSSGKRQVMGRKNPTESLSLEMAFRAFATPQPLLPSRHRCYLASKITVSQHNLPHLKSSPASWNYDICSNPNIF